MSEKKRFVALDSWRGIAAIFVVLFHFAAYSHLTNADFVKHAYLFVDFFFVLSGFVITSSYGERLAKGFSLKKFAFLRFCRIYPLHLFVLICFLLLDLFKAFALGDSLFEGSHSVQGFIASVFLINGMGAVDELVWNTPSWSISVEFFTYLFFAVVIAFIQKPTKIFLLLVVVSPLVLFASGHPNIDITYDLGFVRCLYGFSAGVLCYLIYSYSEKFDGAAMTILYKWLEFIIPLLVAVFVTLFGGDKISILSPFIFAVCVWVFAHEKGMVSRLLTTKPLAFLGLISYSIYLTHYFVQSCFYSAWGMLEKLSGKVMRTTGYKRDALLGEQMWQGDLLIVLMLMAVIMMSTLTYFIIEQPFNKRGRDYISTKKLQPVQEIKDIA